MKVFLDVGAHEGSTLLSVRDPKYGFDRIYCFEPASECWPALERLADQRVTVCRYGLWNRTTEQILYDPGSRGASLYADKFRDSRAHEQIELVRASDWFRDNLRAGDEVYVKLNCEGAEVDIVEDLLDAGVLAQVRSVMIDPDVRKIPSQAHRERELRERLAASGLTNYALEEDVMIGDSHRQRVQHWLRGAGAEDRSFGTRLRQGAYVVAEALRGHREPLRTALGR
ncbi:MAG: FkbM family methyltransferase [Gaiellaceae bacterium]|jgi:FkbM family methyltransferase